MADDILGLGPEWSNTRPGPGNRTADSGGTQHQEHQGSHGPTVLEQPPQHSYEPEAPEPLSEEPPLVEPPADYEADYQYFEEPTDVWEDAPPPGEDISDLFVVPQCNLPSSQNKRVTMIMAALRGAIASLHGASAGVVASEVTTMRSRKVLLEELLDADRSLYYTVVGVLEVLAFETGALSEDSEVSFDFLPSARSQRPAVQEMISELHEMALKGLDRKKCLMLLNAVQEELAREAAKRTAMLYISDIDANATAEELQRSFSNLAAPTTRGSVVNNTWAAPANQWLDQRRAQEAAGPKMTFSSGYPTLDAACSQGDAFHGLIGGGEFWVGAAGTGHGKSAFTRVVITAMTEDLVNGWGYKNGKSILAFTEEEAADVARAAMLDEGQSFHHLSENIILAKVGESRERLVKVVYDVVIEAKRLAAETGDSITEFLPYIYFMDYVSAIKSPGENDNTALSRTADLLMRGIAAWDVEMMSTISGVDFRTYAGFAWPEGMEQHRVAVFALSQLRQLQNSDSYIEGKSDVSRYAVLGPDDKPIWQPRDGDYIMPKREDVYGSSVLLNHATGLIFFHRSRPQAPVLTDPATGDRHVADTRARFYIAKARKSVAMEVVPVAFNSNNARNRGQFFDVRAETKLLPDPRFSANYADCFNNTGDPIIPKRPPRSPFAGVEYN